MFTGLDRSDQTVPREYVLGHRNVRKTLAQWFLHRDGRPFLSSARARGEDCRPYRRRPLLLKCAFHCLTDSFHCGLPSTHLRSQERRVGNNRDFSQWQLPMNGDDGPGAYHPPIETLHRHDDRADTEHAE